MAFTFKLGYPTDKIAADVCRAPKWLEEHLSKVASEFDESALGKVDISLIRGEPFDYLQQCQLYGDYYDYHTQSSSAFYEPNQQHPLVSANSNPTDNNFGHSNDNGQVSNDRAMHPKLFCDTMYIRLVSLLFLIPDEQKAASIQTQIENLLLQFEQKFLHQQ